MATVEIEPDILTAQSLTRPYRMSLETYERIAELGMIRPEEHVILLDGILVQTMTQGSPHYNAVDRGRELLRAALPVGWYVRADGPITLREGLEGVSVPEPDLAVVVGSRERYEAQHPEASDVGLIVEVASSVDAFLLDRQGLARYAFAKIPTVWIVTLYDRKVHVYTEPSGPSANPGYARITEKAGGDPLEAVLSSLREDQLPAVLGPIAVGSFFPPTT